MKPLFKGTEFRKFKHKSLELQTVLLSKSKKTQIFEYCKELGYSVTFAGDMPVIKSADRKRQIFLQEEGNEYFAIQSIPTFNNKYDVIGYTDIKENMSDKFMTFNLWKIGVKSTMLGDTVKALESLFDGKNVQDAFGIQYFHTKSMIPRISG